MESSRVEGSKMQSMISQICSGYTQQQIIHSACDCLLCINDVRPLVPPDQPRERYPNEITIPTYESFFYVLKRCANFRGIVIIPEIIFLQEGMIFYTNDWGKLRMRDKLTNQQAKKFFDDRKQKARFNSKYLQKEKESYVLNYKSGTQQVMSEPQYNKILAKRKNDPFWLQVTYSFKMPDSKETQPPLKSFTYKRSKSVGERMIGIMQKVMNEVDNTEAKNSINKEEGISNASILTLQPNYTQNSIVNNNSFVSRNLSQQFNKMPNLSTEDIRESSTMVSAIFKTQKSRLKGYVSIKNIVEEIVAYLEISAKIRVLQIQVAYTEIDYEPIILSIDKLIVCEVPPEQECYLHDRYKPLEQTGIKELTQLKKMYDKQDQETLWNVCSEILESCLEQRKIKLKIENYKRPPKQHLKQIFMRFFPDFSPSEMFQNINWKNELAQFMQKTRVKINKIIQADEGISILKRFNIVFYRTF